MSSHPAQPPQAPVLWTIAAFAMAALPHLAAMPIQIAVVIVAILIWRVAAARWQWRPPPGWLRVIITLCLLALVMISFGGLWGRRTATALLCIMLAAKMMEMYRVRDLRLVASVCFFLIATQFLFDESLIYLGYLAAGCWLATLSLIRIQHLQTQAGRFTDHAPPPVESLLGALKLLLLAVPIALTLFLLFPRLAQPLWGLPDQVLDGKTGLSEDMSPGSIATLYSDDRPAFRVEFEGPPPSASQLYWRGPVLWNFDGTTWTSPDSTRAATRAPVTVDEDSLRYQVQLEPHERRWLLALDLPARSDHPGSMVTIDYQLVSRRPLTTLSAYSVISNPDFIDTPVLNDLWRFLGLRLPADRNPRTLAMARQWRERYPDDRELIDAIIRWFREEPFYYSLETAPLGRHGADEFLFDLRTGYCEYYASAFAILMRAAGIPTRIVTGYQGGFWNSGGQYMLVRHSDAHAWTEVWLEGSGWTRVDPTAAVSPQRIQQGSSSVIDDDRFLLDWPWVNNLRNQFDRVQHLWNQWVLGFDAQRQLNMLKRLGLPELSQTQIGLLMMLAVVLTGVPLALMMLREASSRSRDPVERAWQRLLRRLRRRGLRKSVDETPLEFAARAAGELDQAGPGLQQLARLYHQVHYGPADTVLADRFIDQARRYQPGQ